jgi:hypothetical protein
LKLIDFFSERHGVTHTLLELDDCGTFGYIALQSERQKATARKLLGDNQAHQETLVLLLLE